MNRQKQIRSVGKILILHLFPGMMLSLIYVLLLRFEVLIEYPKLIILAVAGSFTIIPIEMGCLFYVSKKESGSFNIFNILGLKSKLKVKEYVIYTIFLLGLAGIIMTALKPFSNYLLDSVFSWIPKWYNYNQEMELFRKSFIKISIVVSFLFFTVIGPITEELYFRGYLLARMKWMGKYSILINTILFAVYHFWSPWLIIARIAAFLPLFYFVYKKDSFKLGIFVHCLANFTDVLALMVLL
ncbi:CPBP family intramembrane glutamic endopeptidase [Clostridium paridis]|uniref:CPBP family intramembrane metalloprotease n=1 Tax=Clostridium paridis TaxID=2803863 RepID=A0A937FJR5_9CLOT|nr:CPBP family intramembrane glutamic endopeptidase [Clostridium paridis]MBL4933121.1 CPBP family intramembrane metalloprotease [Clostridium paridis]